MDKYHDCKIVGLYNLGNTCFINSCIQIINNIYELHVVLDNAVVKKMDSHTQLTKEWNDLRNVMWSGNGTVKPTKFIQGIQTAAKSLKVEVFTGWAQNDISEFLMFFLNCIHETYSRKVKASVSTDEKYAFCGKYLQDVYAKEYSEVNELFQGVSITRIMDAKTNEMLSQCPQVFTTLFLPITNGKEIATSLDTCIQWYGEKELLEGDNSWYNDKTKKRHSVLKDTRIWRFPKILIIVLKRFNHRNRKLQQVIDFPIEDFSIDSIGTGPNKALYDCFGVCNHSGNVSGGHYTCFSKNAQGKWFFYNDSRVMKVEKPAQLVSDKAYCLFYRKK